MPHRSCCSPSSLIGPVLGQAARPGPDPDQFPLALHRSMEIDDLDREIQRLHDTVLAEAGRSSPPPSGSPSAGVVSRCGPRARDRRRSATRRPARPRSLAYRELKIVRARRHRPTPSPPTSRRPTACCSTGSRSRRRSAQVDVDYRDYLPQADPRPLPAQGRSADRSSKTSS